MGFRFKFSPTNQSIGYRSELSHHWIPLLTMDHYNQWIIIPSLVLCHWIPLLNDNYPLVIIIDTELSGFLGCVRLRRPARPTRPCHRCPATRCHASNRKFNMAWAMWYHQLHKVWNRHTLRYAEPRVWDASWCIVDLCSASIIDPCKRSIIRIAKNIRKYCIIYKPIIFLDGKKDIYMYIYIRWLHDYWALPELRLHDFIPFRFGSCMSAACPLTKKSHNNWPNISQMRMGHDDELSRFLILLAF